MSVLQFIAAIVPSLAWPIAAVALAIIFRRPLLRLTTPGAGGRLIKRLKAGPVEMEWEGKLDEAAQQAAEVSGSTATTPPQSSGVAKASEDELLSLAETHPTAAVMLAFQRVESALMSAVAPHATGESRNRDGRLLFPTALKIAEKEGILPGELLGAIHGLRELRNQVTHAYINVTTGRATQYVTTANLILKVLQAQGT